MSTSNPIRAWSNEDGDRWFAEGHHSDEAMREAAAAFESEATWREVNAADFSDGIVSRVWLRPINPDDDETPFERVEEGDPGSQPWTVLDAYLDQDAIDQRPQRRPASARREDLARDCGRPGGHALGSREDLCSVCREYNDEADAVRCELENDLPRRSKT